jgi:hypothetical protein
MIRTVLYCALTFLANFGAAILIISMDESMRVSAAITAGLITTMTVIVIMKIAERATTRDALRDAGRGEQRTQRGLPDSVTARMLATMQQHPLSVGSPWEIASHKTPPRITPADVEHDVIRRPRFCSGCGVQSMPFGWSGWRHPTGHDVDATTGRFLWCPTPNPIARWCQHCGATRSYGAVFGMPDAVLSIPSGHEVDPTGQVILFCPNLPAGDS